MRNIQSYIITCKRSRKKRKIQYQEGTSQQRGQGELILQIQPWGRIEISLHEKIEPEGDTIR
ncbi:hypothetical protein C922_03310 [Plasmodium inui San Antonio 1]|uniref:Uncharacterized protein n=1 Tax=Plasmodium inui San Antonio 1 TaxID=1237626 RepID=W7ABC1_9APIC|nr:hypothetical protein C922_03310 [Plasmodium inui San Antonio 1]EUD66394.1 hypothetical protein C922_03310 [Plasmodium inui San Antonio 1]